MWKCKYILFEPFLNLKETTPSHFIRADLEHFDGRNATKLGTQHSFPSFSPSNIERLSCVRNCFKPLLPCIHILLMCMQETNKSSTDPQNIQIEFNFCVRHNKDIIYCPCTWFYDSTSSYLHRTKPTAILSLLHVKISLTDSKESRRKPEAQLNLNRNRKRNIIVLVLSQGLCA